MASNLFKSIWTRDEVSSCSCSEKSYRHVHCRCSRCNGRAKSRSTEMRHWRDVVSQLKSNDIANESVESDAADQSEPEGDQGMEEEEVRSDAAKQVESEGDQRMEEERGTEGQRSRSASDSDTRDNRDVDVNPMKQLIVKAVLDALRIKQNSGVSVKTFEEVLEYGKTLLFTSLGEDVDCDILSTLWPKSWNDVQLLLKEEGYEGAQDYFICFCREEKEFTRNGKTTKKFVYNGKYGIMESKHDSCPHCGGTGYIKYLYLGLDIKIKNWFRDKTFCKKMLAHWLEREHWLDQSGGWEVKKEIWDGKRWSELQWFWNPESVWALPTLCVHCDMPISADYLINSPDGHGDSKTVECPVCFDIFQHPIQWVKGSPLNLALIGHWDGWQPFGTSYRGSGSFEVSIANMRKVDRNHVDEVYVVGFVPCFEVPNVPQTLDPFLQPLMKDICKQFVQGIQVDYPKGIEIDDYEPSEEETVRVLLLCWTADHPGQCETGKFLNQGRCPCRRCKLVGQHLENSANTHYYYGGNRYHFRHPWGQRSIESQLENDLFDIENETRPSVRKRMSSEKGFTGISVFHKYLYPLYGFDVLNHLVYDVYHTVPLNVVKNQFSRLLDLEMVDRSYLDKQIANFPWTRELKNGRVPQQIGKDCKGIGYWKAESFQKFSFPMAECIMEYQVDPKEYEILSLVSRLTELHFHDGRNGWTDEMIHFHQKLAWRLNILIEEVQGLSMCTISLHNLLHIYEDIINFSAPDNFWCAVFERAVKGYVKRSHNGKGIEATFAHAEARREFLKSCKGKVQIPSNPGKYDISLGIVSSIVTAKQLSQVKPPPREAFLVGPMSNMKPIEVDDRNKIAELLSVDPCTVPVAAFVSNRCFKPDVGIDGTSFLCGDTVIVLVGGQETVVRLQGFLSIRIAGDHFSLLGKGISHALHYTDDGQVHKNFWSGFVKAEGEPQVLNSFMFEIKNICRKVILHPCNSNLVTVVDYMRQLRHLPHAVIIPVYPEAGDMVLIQGEEPEDIWHGHVQSVDLINKTVDVFFYVKNQRHDGCYVREVHGRHARNRVAWDSLIGIASGHWGSISTWVKED